MIKKFFFSLFGLTLILSIVLSYNVSNFKGPDFIVLGAQKAGTSWMFDNIFFHPEASMSPVKELNIWYSYEANDDYTQPINWGHIKYSKTPIRTFFWYMVYKYMPNNSFKYKLLFYIYSQENKISGDISPSYTILKRETLRKISEDFPDTKIIYLLRDPIDRAWSCLKMHAGQRNIKIEEESLLTFVKLKQDGCTDVSKYSDVVENAQFYFNENFKIFYYDDIARDPLGAFDNIAAFLGVSKIRSERTKNIVWEGPKLKIPQSIHDIYKVALEQEYNKLIHVLPNHYTERWYNMHYGDRVVSKYSKE